MEMQCRRALLGEDAARLEEYQECTKTGHIAQQQNSLTQTEAGSGCRRNQL